ncbi:alkaline-phosphatase-like protein [Pilobolus umbonatus]|nr:alkaline-phosphatase-like protein [Pilobolus umbonatus]
MSSSIQDSLLSNSNNLQYQSIGPTTDEQKPTRKIIHIVVMTLLSLLLVAGVLYYALVFAEKKEERPLLSNGTHTFSSTVILISLDGVVNHDLDLHITPELSRIANEGIRADYMTPSFPPITFPNHWSLVTGLYPESHGVVGNYFYDPALNDSFYYKSPARSWDSKWWGGEPIWITAVKQDRKSAVIMWPGCSTEFDGVRPSYVMPYSDYVTFDEKINQVFDWFDLPLEDRPEFVGLYVPQIDQAGHAYGPYANETMTQLQLADKSIRYLMRGLEERNLTNIVNVMIVSDHGMSETDKSRLIYYDRFLTEEEMGLIWKTEASPLLGIRVYPDLNEAEAVDRLYNAFKRYENTTEAHFKAYKREDIPSRFYFQDNVRIPPLLILPDVGWNFVTLNEFNPDKESVYHPRGVHGYDNLSPESRAIFVAEGPYFPRGQRAKPFQNVELYNVMSNILNLKAAENNNTLNGVLKIEFNEGII